MCPAWGNSSELSPCLARLQTLAQSTMLQKQNERESNTDLKHTFVSRAGSDYKLNVKDFYLHEISKSYYLWKCAQISWNSSKGRNTNYSVLYAYFWGLSKWGSQLSSTPKLSKNAIPNPLQSCSVWNGISIKPSLKLAVTLYSLALQGNDFSWILSQLFPKNTEQ